MTITVQNLRSFASGTEPDALLPGQLCFNLTDKVVYVGDGSSSKTSFDGTVSPGVSGEGWYAMPMDFSGLGDYFVQNPAYWGDNPTDNQVLTWSQPLGHPIWTSGGSGGGGQAYQVTNNAVALAPGATTSAKISAAIGVVSPDEGDTTIVTGQPGEVYQGLYIYLTEWVRAASYAYPTAGQVTYDPSTSGLPAINVQGALDALDVQTTAAQNTANTANSTANAAAAAAAAALPKAGGTMTGTITFAAGQTFPVSGIQNASGVQKGVVQGGTNMTFPSAGVIDVRGATTSQTGVVMLTDSTTTTSSTLAATASAAKNLQDQINNLTLSNSVTLAGTLNAATGQVDSVTPDGTAAGFTSPGTLPAPAAGNNNYYVIVSTGGNYSPPGGGGPYAASSGDWFLSNGTTWQFLGVGSRPAYASTTTAGIVQLADNATTQAGTNSILAIVPSGLQSKISDSVAITSSTCIASSTAVKTAYDLANAALPIAGGTMTGTLGTLNINISGTCCIRFASGVSGSLNAISDSTNLTSSTTAASSTALKAAYDLANAALPKAGGTMTGDLIFSGVGVGLVFNDASVLDAISDSTALTSSITAASSTAVKAAFDLANAAIPDATITAKGDLIAGTGAATYSALPVGTNKTFLVANSACTEGMEWAVSCVTGTAPVQIDNTDSLNPVVSVDAASTTAPGIVQLNDTVSSTSTTEALTANQGYLLQQQIDALAVTSNLTFAGTYDANTGLMDSVSVAGTAAGFVVGSALPAAAAGNIDYFVIVDVQGSIGPAGTPPYHIGDWFLSDGTAWQFLNVGFQAPYASTTVEGVVQLATNAEVQTGTNTDHVVVPSALQSKISDSTSTTSSTCIASSTAVKAAYDIGAAAIPCSLVTAKGNLIAASGSSTPVALPVGTNGQFLSANTACTSGLEWCTISLACVPCSAFTAAGELLAGTGASTFTAIPAGTTGQLLTADTACTGGMKWSTDCFVNDSCYSAKGVVLAGTGSGTFSALSVGSDGQFLVADSACTTGLKWTTECFINDSCYTAKGVLLVGTGAGTVTALPVGSSGQVLVPNATCTAGVEWITCQGLGICGYTCDTPTVNTAIGFCAGDSITSGTGNTLLGYNNGTTVTTGCNNTAIGAYTGDGIGAGTDNTIVGFNATGASTSVCRIVAIGRDALFSTGALGNVAVGYQAACTNSSGLLTAVGYCALRAMNASNNNTAVGYCAGVLATSADGTYVGHLAGAAITTGTCNTVIGSNAGVSNTIGTDNLIAGACAGNATTGSFNVILGSQAGRAATSLSCSIVIGYNAAVGVATGTQNIAIGRGAGAALTTASCTTLVGHCAGAASTTTCNTAVGWCALGTAITSGHNTAIGLGALQLSSTVCGSVAIGHTAAQNSSGTGVVAIGRETMLNNTTGVNTAIGFCALRANITGTGSTVVGFQAGNAATGGGHTLIGNNSGCAITTGTNNTIVGPYVGTAALANNVVLSDGSANIRFQSNSSGAWSPDGTNYGTAGQILQSNGTGAAPTWGNAPLAVTTSTKSLSSGTPINLASWSSGTRMGNLTVMASSGTDLVWANITIAATSGVGYSVVTTQAGTIGTFTVTAGGSGETLITLTPSLTLASATFTFQYSAATGAQPTIL